MDLDLELATAAQAGVSPAADPLPETIKMVSNTVAAMITVDKWAELFDASQPCPARCPALDVILDMPAAYEVLGSGLAAMKQHVYDLTEKLLLIQSQDKGFTFDDALRHHAMYNVRGMCGAVASTRNTHIGNALSVDPLCARTPYTALSMFLIPSPCKLADKTVYERPMPIGGSNTRKSKLHDRARTLLTQGLKAKLLEKGLLFKWTVRSPSAQSSGTKKPAGRGKGKVSKGGAGANKGGPKGVAPKAIPQPKNSAPVPNSAALDDDDDPSGADASMEVGPSKVIVADSDFAWLFINARVTFEGLIDHANEQAVSLPLGLGPRIFYASEEGSLTMALPGQPAKAGALSFEEFILFSDGTAAKVAAGCKRSMMDANIGGLVMLQPTQIPAVFGQLSGRNPTKRWRICLNNDALTTNTDDIESRIGADCTVCLASEVEGLQYQLDNFFPRVERTEGGGLRFLDGAQEPLKQFILEEKGRKILLSFWEQICKACNTCHGRADPRMRDHFTDSLGIFQCRVFKVYVETVNDMNILLPTGVAKIPKGSRSYAEYRVPRTASFGNCHTAYRIFGELLYRVPRLWGTAIPRTASFGNCCTAYRVFWELPYHVPRLYRVPRLLVPLLPRAAFSGCPTAAYRVSGNPRIPRTTCTR